MQSIKKIKLFLSSYIPLYIMFLISRKDTLFKSNKGKLVFLIIIFIIVYLFAYAIIALYRKKNIVHMTLDISDSNIYIDSESMNYLMTYVVPLLLDFDNITIIFTLFVTIGILYCRFDLIYINPVWALLGYVTYNIGDRVIITNYKKYELMELESIEIVPFIVEGVFVAYRN